MFSLQILLLLPITLVVIKIISLSQAFSRNVSAARASGLPYIFVPVFIQHTWWLIGQGYILPVLNRLPRSWTESWLPLLVMRRVWHHGYTPFRRVDSDTFIAVSPTGNVLWTCDPDFIVNLSARRADFPKPLGMLGMLNLFGPTITATEGSESRLYRKIASPSFNENTHRKVWNYTIEESGALLRRWDARTRQNKDGILLHDDAARMTLHVLSYCAYGRKMVWDDGQSQRDISRNGHKLSYSEAIASMLARMPVIFMTPPKVLQSSPRKIHKDAYESFTESRRYFEELRDEKQTELRMTTAKQEPNLLDALVQSSDFPGKKDDALITSTDAHISPEAVLGNIFIFILAGHETNANSIVFALTMLACHPSIQRALQEDIDRKMGDRAPSEWTYEVDFPILLDGYTGAVFNEVQRLFTVLPIFPKSTESQAKSLVVRGKQYTIPANTLILINTSAVHRNPKYWGSPSREVGDGESAPFPVSQFDPKRWINGFHPGEGTFIPFAEGSRACMGQRFAKADFVACLTRMMMTHSVELATHGDRHENWLEAKTQAERELSEGVSFFMALKMNEGVPLRFVKRGHEQWPQG